MGYTSEQTGFLLLPGALASVVAMLIASRTVHKIDPRLALAGGAALLVTSLMLLTRLSPQTGESDLFWPLIIRSFGTVFMFLPLSLATLGPILKKDVAAATGFFNLTRQLGGSIGVALLATILSTREAFHRAVLVEKLVPSDPHLMDRLNALAAGLQTRGVSAEAAHGQALAILDRTVGVQAAVLSFGDTFWFTAALVLCFVPLIFLLGKPRAGAAVGAGH